MPKITKKRKQRKTKYIKCPRDPDLMYERKICEEVFRKNGIRPWCKDCKIFERKD